MVTGTNNHAGYPPGRRRIDHAAQGRGILGAARGRRVLGAFRGRGNAAGVYVPVVGAAGMSRFWAACVQHHSVTRSAFQIPGFGTRAVWRRLKSTIIPGHDALHRCHPRWNNLGEAVGGRGVESSRLVRQVCSEVAVRDRGVRDRGVRDCAVRDRQILDRGVAVRDRQSIVAAGDCVDISRRRHEV